jgi:hypothetical protein
MSQNHDMPPALTAPLQEATSQDIAATAAAQPQSAQPRQTIAKWSAACPNAGMGHSTAQAFLRIAVDLIGADQVALRLNSPRHLLDAWLRDQATMPERKLLALIDLLEKLRTVESHLPAAQKPANAKDVVYRGPRNSRF